VKDIKIQLLMTNESFYQYRHIFSIKFFQFARGTAQAATQLVPDVRVHKFFSESKIASGW